MAEVAILEATEEVEVVEGAGRRATPAEATAICLATALKAKSGTSGIEHPQSDRSANPR